jgi:SprT protein
MTELQKLAVQAVENAFIAAEKQYGRPLKRVPVTFSNRMTKTSGVAYYGREIRLSNKLLELNGQAFIKEVPGHEAAHIIAEELYKREGEGHGARWKQVMCVVGVAANRTHNLQVVETLVEMFNYTNAEGIKKQLTPRKHKSLQSGRFEYYQWKGGVKVYARDYVA